ncbi:MAG: hypothetical protein QXU65_05655 [Sulfolobales archaeon]
MTLRRDDASEKVDSTPTVTVVLSSLMASTGSPAQAEEPKT